MNGAKRTNTSQQKLNNDFYNSTLDMASHLAWLGMTGQTNVLLCSGTFKYIFALPRDFQINFRLPYGIPVQFLLWSRTFRSFFALLREFQLTKDGNVKDGKYF